MSSLIIINFNILLYASAKSKRKETQNPVFNVYSVICLYQSYVFFNKTMEIHLKHTLYSHMQLHYP